MHNRLHLAQMARERTRRKRIALRPIGPSRGAEVAYRRALAAMLRETAQIIRQHVMPATVEAEAEMTRDTAADRLRGALDLLRSALEFRLRRSAETMVERVLNLEFERHTERFKQSLRSAVGIDLQNVLSRFDLDDEFTLAVRRNVALIKGMADETLKRIETRVTTSVMRGGGHRTLAKDLTHELGIMQQRAKLIARDQTAKLNSDLNRMRQEQVGIATYEWSTSQDERVRDSHAAMEGRICKWDDPTVYRDEGDTEWRSRSSIGGVELHPGEDIQCRCVPVAIMEIEESPAS